MRAAAALTVLLAVVAAPASAGDALQQRALPGGAAGYGTTSCDAFTGPLPGSGRVLHVGERQRFPAIQAAVDAAREGDTILIAPGTYAEVVKVRTPGLRIRGTSRAGVVLDGGLTRRTGLMITADRVVVENMTLRHYLDGPVAWVDVTGFWGSHLTFYANRLAGLAFESRCGQVNDVHATGQGLSSMASLVCHPCDTILTRIVGEETNLGLAALDVGGNFVLQDSLSRRNHIGLAFGNPDHEGPPPSGALIRRNRILDNNNRTAPAVETTASTAGVGVIVIGGRKHTLERNEIRDHELAGLAVLGNPGVPEHPPTGHVLRDNLVSGSGVADLMQDSLAGPDNCWSDNEHATAQPPALEVGWSCDLPTTPPGGVPAFAATLLPELAAAGDWRTWPAPADPGAWRSQPDDDGDGRYADDGAVDRWLPELPRVAHAPRTTPAPAATRRTADEMATMLLAPLRGVLRSSAAG